MERSASQFRRSLLIVSSFWLSSHSDHEQPKAAVLPTLLGNSSYQNVDLAGMINVVASRVRKLCMCSSHKIPISKFLMPAAAPPGSRGWTLLIIENNFTVSAVQTVLPRSMRQNIGILNCHGKIINFMKGPQQESDVRNAMMEALGKRR